jgi:hypothetical protein
MGKGLGGRVRVSRRNEMKGRGRSRVRLWVDGEQADDLWDGILCEGVLE